MKKLLSDEQKQHFESIETEIQSLLDACDFEKAYERLESILKAVPDTDEWRLFRAALHSQEAECLLELEEEERAEELAASAIASGWSTPQSHAILAWSYYHCEDYDGALHEFSHALSLDRDHAPALFGRALVHRALDELELAHADVNAAMEADGDYVTAFALAVEIEVELGNRKKATDILNAGRAKWPHDAELALLDAQLQASSKNISKALAALHVVLDAEVVPAEARLLEVELLIRKGDFAEAKRQAVKASNLYSDEAFAFVQLAVAQLLSGKASVALKAAERSVELDPTLPDAYSIRAAARLVNHDYQGGMKDLRDIDGEDLELPAFLYGVAFKDVDPSLLKLSYQELLDKNIESAKNALEAAASSGADETDHAANNSNSNTTQESNPFGGANPFASMPKMPPGFNPSTLINQMFDSEGNVRPMFKPILKMALKNAPSLLKSMPSEMLAGQNIDPSIFEKSNLDKMTDEEFDRQMKLFYKMLKDSL